MSERERFEAWVSELDCPAVSIIGVRESDGTYYNFEAQLAWEAWQARAGLTTEGESKLVKALESVLSAISGLPDLDDPDEETPELRRLDAALFNAGAVLAGIALATHEHNEGES